MANRILDIEQQLHAELAILTTAQSELDQAMATVAPLQLRVDESQAKVGTLMSELQMLLNGQPSPSSQARSTASALQPPSQQVEAKPTANKVSRRTRPRSSATKKVSAKPIPNARAKNISPSKTSSTRKTFSVEGRIRLARSAAEMQARKKGLSPRLVRKAGDAMEAKKRAELGV